MSDDFFVTAASAPPTAPVSEAPGPVAPGWRPPAPPAAAAPNPPGTVTLSAGMLAGLAGCAAGLLACLGAWAPWFSISVAGISADVGGLHAHVDGRYLLITGLVAAVCGAAIAVLPSGSSERQLCVAVLALVGVIGLVVVIHRYIDLSNASAAVNVAGAAIGLHASAGWGLWLDGAACTAMLVAAFAAALL